MLLRSTKKTARSWGTLPVEVRLMILEEISRQKFPGWASCAAVCKEWQTVVAEENFRRLTLRSPCLEEFRFMGVRHRDFVQHIYLHIELPRYTCRSCRLGQSPRNSAVFKKSVKKLFSVLRTWQPTGCLVLELNAHSSSDSEHWFKDWHFGPEHEDVGNLVQQQEATTRWHDPKHHWVNGQQANPPPDNAVLGLFGMLCLAFLRKLPTVPVVTGLVIRRQFRRQISSTALEQFWERLPRLENVVWEPYRTEEASWKIALDLCLAACIRQALPSQVKTLTIFEGCNDQLTFARRRSAALASLLDLDRSPENCRKLAGAFAWRSYNLERLSVSYMIEAQDFLKTCHRSLIWYHLQSLTPTSSILSRTAPREEIWALLYDASLAAMRMPQLESMVLWNSKNGEACAAIYQRDKTNRIATFTWRGTWNLNLSQDVIESWQKIVSDFGYLRIKGERIEGLVKSQGDAIHNLRLPAAVIDPVSMWQIRQEEMTQRVG